MNNKRITTSKVLSFVLFLLFGLMIVSCQSEFIPDQRNQSVTTIPNPELSDDEVISSTLEIDIHDVLPTEELLPTLTVAPTDAPPTPTADPFKGLDHVIDPYAIKEGALYKKGTTGLTKIFSLGSESLLYLTQLRQEGDNVIAFDSLERPRVSINSQGIINELPIPFGVQGIKRFEQEAYLDFINEQEILKLAELKPMKTLDVPLFEPYWLTGEATAYSLIEKKDVVENRFIFRAYVIAYIPRLPGRNMPKESLLVGIPLGISDETGEPIWQLTFLDVINAEWNIPENFPLYQPPGAAADYRSDHTPVLNTAKNITEAKRRQCIKTAERGTPLVYWSFYDETDNALINQTDTKLIESMVTRQPHDHPADYFSISQVIFDPSFYQECESQ